MDSRSVADRRARWAVAAIFFVNGAIFGSWAAHIPLVKDRLDIGHATLGLALLAMAVGALIAMPLGGAATARYGSAAVTRVATFVFVLAFPLPVLAPDPIWLAAALLIFGAGNGVMDVAMNAHGVAVETRMARPVMSSFHGMFSLGGLVGAATAAALLPVMAPLWHAILVTVVLALASLAAIAWLLPAGVDKDSGGAAFAIPTKASIGLGALAFLALGSEGAILDWSALHLQQNVGLGAGLAATGFAAFSGAMAVGRFSGDWLRSAFGATALVRTSALVAAAGLALALLFPFPLIAIPGFAIVGLGMANLVPVFFGAAGRLAGQGAGTAIAAVATMGYAGFLTGPPLIGFVAETMSLSTALGLVVLACLLVGLAANAVGPAERSAAGLSA